MRASPILKALGLISLTLIGAGAAYAAVPIDGNHLFQEAASPGMEKIEALHNIVLWLIAGIVALVMVLMVIIFIKFNEKANPVPSKTSHNTLLEVVWTGVPVVIVLVLISLASPVLYYLDEIPEAHMTIKATGNQWNWDYTYPDQGDFEFNSSVAEASAASDQGAPYLLATTEPMVVPAGKVIRMVITANDVLHAWAVPSFGVKIDAVPGRLNETWFQVDEPGTYYGQCSEICGLDHYNMPIEVKVLPEAEFDAWVLTKNPNYVKNATDATQEASLLGN